MNETTSKNVKIPTDLIAAIKKRAPDAPPGETLLQIYRDYEKLETLAHCVADKDADFSKITVYDAIKSYMDSEGKKFEGYQRSIDELKTMLQGLQLFFTKIKS